jgi:esterase/lipase superfamily enzyme/TRAP-type C4-dicarboxylate transport system substrate-binding protein
MVGLAKLPRNFRYSAMLNIMPIFMIITAFSVETSNAADVLALRLTVPREPGSAMSVGAESIDAGLTAHLSKFVKVDKITVSQDPLKDLYNNKADIAVVSTASLSSGGAEEFAIFDLPFLFSGPSDTTAAQQQGAAGAVILSSLHKQGLVGLGFWNEGMSKLFGATVRDFDDLKGKRVCVIGSATAGYTADANGWAAEFATQSNRLSSQKASYVLVALGATPVNIESSNPPQNATSWQSTCRDTSDVIEATPMSIDTADLAPTTKSITSRGFRPLVYVVVMREQVWDALTSRVQQGLVEEVARSADAVNKDATNQELAALNSLYAKGFVLVSTNDKDTKGAEKAWRGAVGGRNAELLNLILSVTGQARQPPPPPPPTSIPEKHGEILNKDLNNNSKLLFATDRRDDNDKDPDPQYRFANAAGKLSYGVVSVNTDPDRRLTKSIGKTELRRIDVFTQEEFKKKFAAALADEGSKSVLIYVHGFWTTFMDAALSAKIFGDDLNLGKVIILYSWPSNGQPQLYLSDEDRVLAGRNDFIDFLKLVSSVAGVDNVSVFAHSMGARLTTFALDYMSANSTNSQPPIHQVVLAAPDIDVNTFSNELAAYGILVQKTTIYASAFDTALMCSEGIHSDRRVGQGGDSVFVSPGVDTIDASEVEKPPSWAGWLGSIPCIGGGHSYYIDNLSVQADIHELISLGVEPSQRHGLVRLSGKDYWVFKGAN